jgi:capsid protein
LRQANYSSLRAGKIEFRRLIEQLQWLTIIPQCHKRIAEGWVQRAVLEGVLPPRRDGYRWTFVTPANEPIDPKKDLEADVMAVRAGRMSPQEFIASWGRDWREVVGSFSSFLAEVDAAGLVFDIDPRRTSQSGNLHGDEASSGDADAEGAAE